MADAIRFCIAAMAAPYTALSRAMRPFHGRIRTAFSIFFLHSNKNPKICLFSNLCDNPIQ